MGIVKVIEVIAHSEVSFDDAVKQAVAEASKSVRNIDSVYVKDMKCHVNDGKIATYGVICKVSFLSTIKLKIPPFGGIFAYFF